MFGWFKDWRRIAEHDDRYPKAFVSAIVVAATFTFWLVGGTRFCPNKA